jgi:hypothetical protein
MSWQILIYWTCTCHLILWAPRCLAKPPHNSFSCPKEAKVTGVLTVSLFSCENCSRNTPSQLLEKELWIVQIQKWLSSCWSSQNLTQHQVIQFLVCYQDPMLKQMFFFFHSYLGYTSSPYHWGTDSDKRTQWEWGTTRKVRLFNICMSSFASHKSPIDFSTDLALTGLFKAKDFKGTLKKKHWYPIINAIASGKRFTSWPYQ